MSSEESESLLKDGSDDSCFRCSRHFSSYFVYSSLIFSLMKMSLMTSLTMMVFGPGSPPVHAFLHFLNYMLIVLVDCHITESINPFVVSVEYFQFTAQKLL